MPTGSDEVPSRPNVLYIHSHDTGRFIEPYGSPVSTPNLQRLSEDGVMFRQAFCAQPTCSPSRAALLTGTYPHNNGMLGLAHRGFSLNDYGHHLVHTLQEAGYHCALSGVQHVDRNEVEGYARNIGYDQILNNDREDKYSHPNRTAEAVEFLREGPEEPFFLSVGYSRTHRSFSAPDHEDDPRYCRPPAPFPDTPELREEVAGLKRDARGFDSEMGRVFDALNENNLADETLVICTTDHGLPYPGMKCNLTDRGTGVFLVMRGPGGFTGGQVIDSMVSQLDVFPTVCDVADIEPPDRLQGESLQPLIYGERDRLHEAIFTELNVHACYEPRRAIRTERWKYVRRFDGRVRPLLANSDDGAAKDLWIEHGWRTREAPEEELYDIVWDPNEANNLAEDPEHEDVLDDLRDRLTEWMEETDDPLLDGRLPLPEGARLNLPHQLSPTEPATVLQRRTPPESGNGGD